jgi:hypothetical protein
MQLHLQLLSPAGMPNAAGQQPQQHFIMYLP